MLNDHRFRLCPLVLWVCSCTGDPFYYAAPETETLPAADQLSGSGTVQGGTNEPSSNSADVPNEVEASPTETSPCGDLRVADPELEDGEVCFGTSLFTMGSSEPNFNSGYVVHGPEHEVSLSAFVLGAHEVTVARYRQCVLDGECNEPLDVYEQGCTYSELPSSLDLAPITCVTHQEASAFCRWDGGRSLPTEAQWERAARGEESRDFPWSDDFRCSYAIVAARSQCSQYESLVPRAVGSAPGGDSPEGVHDLIGNAAEWVADWGAGYSRRPAQDPVGPDSGSLRVYKGGGWKSVLDRSAAYVRGVADPGSRSPFSFRCARPAAP